MKDVQDWIAVKRLFKRGVKIKQIAKQLKMSKNTVKKLLKSENEPKYERKLYNSIIDPYAENIRTWFLDNEEKRDISKITLDSFNKPASILF